MIFLHRLYTLILRQRRAVLLLFAAAALLCLALKPLVQVDYDISDYLPPGAPSTTALDCMAEEFGGGIPNARVMVRDVSLAQALQTKAALQQVDGVLAVNWLDDTLDLSIPLEMQPASSVESWYKDGSALFSVTIANDKRLEAVRGIRALAGESGALTGTAVSTAAATETTVTEIRTIVIISVIYVILVLLLTTGAWFAPVVLLLGLGAAIAINGGSNLIFGTISFVTNAAGSVLQLAVSLDYSVFLLHRFEESRAAIDDPTEAMADALCRSTGSILSSGLTTVIGFLALCLMQFRLGPDLGLALAKGVAISLITTFTFLPCLILVCLPLLDKTRHRSLVPDLHGFGRLICRVMLPMALLFVLVVAPAWIASNSNDYYYGAAHMFAEDTRVGADSAAIEDVFGKSDTYVLLIPNDSMPHQSALSAALHALPEVTSILSFVDNAGAQIPTQYLDESVHSLLFSENMTRMVITAAVDTEGTRTFALVERIRAIAQEICPNSYLLAGQGVSTYDLMDTITSDMTKVNLLAIAAVFVVLLVMLRSLTLPLILVLSIETAIWLNLSIPYLTGAPVYYIAYLIISTVQLGATVDYAILLTDRYREYRASMSKREAVVEVISSCTVSVLTSGSALAVVGFLMGRICTNLLIAQLGSFLGVGALFSLLIVLFVLPGLLVLLDRTFMRSTAASA